MADYVPKSDSEFNLWQGNLVTIVVDNKTPWGVLPDSLADLQNKQTRWINAFAKASVKQNRTPADVQEKSDARTDYEPALRGFVSEFLAGNSKVSDSDRARMGLTVKSTTRTPVAAPSTRPVAIIDYSVRLQHTINFADEGATSKAKPVGVHGCEIFYKIDGAAPVDASELSYLATDTATPYVTTFEGKYAGKTVYYMLRWVNTRGEQGPWSSTFSAMVVG
jgi:hypothetical protein